MTIRLILLAALACATAAFAQPGSLLGVAPESGAVNPATPPGEPAYTGDFPDPFVLADGGGWLAYGTNTGGANVPLLRSTDLARWTWAGDALPQLPAWAAAGRSLTWAPSVLPRGASWVLYFTARDTKTDLQQIGCAVASRPEGPFASAATAPLISTPELGGAIDPSPFVDDDGTAYLLWKNDGNARNQPTQLWIRRLTADGLAFDGPAVPLLERTAAWEKPLIEGPSLVKANGAYHLFYSGGWWESDGYGIGHAVATHVTGPFTKTSTSAPLLGTHGAEAGPGGQEFFAGPGGVWMAYHAWTAGKVGYGAGGARSLRVTPVSFGSNNPVIGQPAAGSPPPPPPSGPIASLIRIVIQALMGLLRPAAR